MASTESWTRPESRRFSDLLHAWRRRAGYSQNELARRAGIDPAYVNRMEAAGQPVPVLPRRRVVEAVAGALSLSRAEADQFLVAAGYCPNAVLQIGAWDQTLGVVADVLGDPALSAEDRQEFREVIRLVAARWHRTA